jgi:hypothetical protein
MGARLLARRELHGAPRTTREEGMRTLGPRNSVHVFDSAARWAHRGEEMRTLADEAPDPTVKAMLLRLAADCEFLARHAERHDSRDLKVN